jgi:hypothetical protein
MGLPDCHEKTQCGIVQGYINGAEPHPPALATPINSIVPVISIEHHQAKPCGSKA